MQPNKKTTPKISGFDTFSQTPFSVELTSKLITPKAEHSVVEDKATGQLYGMYEIPKGKTILHDAAKYTKLFAGNSLILAGLNEPATKMFYFICENITPGNDEICIIREDYLSFYNYTAANKFAYYKAIEGLLYATIIARKTGNTTCFFVNPNIIFNGDRTKLKNVTIVKPKQAFTFSKDTTDDEVKAEFEQENS